MSRDKFIRELEDFNKHFNQFYGCYMENAGFEKEGTAEYLDKKNIGQKLVNDGSNYHSYIDIKKIKGITLRRVDKLQIENHCFEPFYNIEPKDFRAFCIALHDTHLGLVIEEKSSQDMEEKNSTLINKIDAVLELPLSESTMSELNEQKEKLKSAKYLSEDRIFRSLLAAVAYTLNDRKNSNKVARVTNGIIKYYFDKKIDKCFTRQSKIENYRQNKYHNLNGEMMHYHHS